MLQSASEEEESEGGWRPFVVCISKDTFHRFMAFNMVRWISHKYGFGTYIHYIEGYLNKDTHKEAEETLKKLLKMGEISKSKVYVDTIISPSYTSAIAQVIQLPGISGNENNMMFFEYSRREPEALQEVLNNFKLLRLSIMMYVFLEVLTRGLVIVVISIFGLLQKTMIMLI